MVMKQRAPGKDFKRVMEESKEIDKRQGRGKLVTLVPPLSQLNTLICAHLGGR